VRAVFAAVALLVSMVVAGQPAAPAIVPSPIPVTSAPAPAMRDPLAEAIRERVDYLRYETEHDHRDLVVRGARVVLGDTLARYYESQQFQAKWRDPARLDLLIAALAELRDDGLDPADYHVAALQAFRTDQRATTSLPPMEQADLDMLATDSMMLALYHLYLGKVDPVKLSAQWNFSTRPISVESAFARLTAALDSGQIRETFARARPQHVWYQRGRERLREYRALAAAGGWSPISDGPVLRPGMTDPRVPALRHRLEVTSDVPAPSSQPYPPSELYDDDLVKGMRHFQERHGLTPDGIVGSGTRAALNVPVSARIDQIRVNLERGRWALHEVQGEFVLVDVAGFYVSYFRNDEPIWTSRVVVGRDERETPVFRSTITYVVINPTWTIPPGILVKDKLPALRRDPGTLQRSNIRVLDGSGREVNPYSVNWNRYSATNLPPYQFRQDPGPDNALGLVKIMFPNPYLVYLHDSPAKSLYEKDERTFSSGCIRVQKPFELAELVLNDPQWNQQAIAEVVASKQTRTVNLKKPVPVLILYWTAQPRPDGQVVFRNDVYGRDAVTLAALDGDFRLPPR
jgi:murein L,D-transpeptidase YcbB/YkuD